MVKVHIIALLVKSSIKESGKMTSETDMEKAFTRMGSYSMKAYLKMINLTAWAPSTI